MDKKNTKIVFMGTPEFSAKILSGLLDDGYNIISVITESDKPVGRKMEILPTPVKKFALENGLAVFQPETKNDITNVVKELNPDLVVVVAYGKIITKETLEIPKYGCINFHASLLPALRGASPIQTAILAGLEKTGTTVMLMDEGMDTGPILSQVDIILDEKETTSTLREKMLEYGLNLLLETIPKYINGEVKPLVQGSEATYTKMITKEDGKIDFNKSAREEERKIRAFNEWPGVFAFWREKRLKILETDFGNQPSRHKAGEVFLDGDGGLCVSFIEGYWMVKKLQLESGKPLLVGDFLNGNKEIVGEVLK